MEGYVEHYNNVRLNSATGYIIPKDMLAGRQQEINGQRDRKLETARKQRQIRRQQAADTHTLAEGIDGVCPGQSDGPSSRTAF